MSPEFISVGEHSPDLHWSHQANCLQEENRLGKELPLCIEIWIHIQHNIWITCNKQTCLNTHRSKPQIQRKSPGKIPPIFPRGNGSCSDMKNALGNTFIWHLLWHPWASPLISLLKKQGQSVTNHVPTDLQWVQAPFPFWFSCLAPWSCWDPCHVCCFTGPQASPKRQTARLDLPFSTQLPAQPSVPGKSPCNSNGSRHGGFVHGLKPK